MSAPRLLFAGTPDFAVPTLRALLDLGHEVVGVLTQPDRPAGRGRALRASPVKTFALAHRLPVDQPARLRGDADALARIAALAPDLMIVVAYGLLLPPEVLAVPRLGCVNVHASLLPRWRGAAPIQRALLAGDTRTGVCIMRMAAGLDTGPVYLSHECPILPADTGGSLHDRLAELGATALRAALPGILDGALPPTPQDEAQATYAHKLTKEEAEIDWCLPAADLARRIRAFDPWPVCQTRLRGETLRLWSAQAEPETAADAPPGTVLQADRHGLRIATGAGVLRLLRVQPAGKRVMRAEDFLNARSLAGARFD